jgi:hypothetical protein
MDIDYLTGFLPRSGLTFWEVGHVESVGRIYNNNLVIKSKRDYFNEINYFFDALLHL